MSDDCITQFVGEHRPPACSSRQLAANIFDFNKSSQIGRQAAGLCGQAACAPQI
jgi:hypothetical protein